jgi:hypothetical protein
MLDIMKIEIKNGEILLIYIIFTKIKVIIVLIKYLGLIK